MNFRLFIVRVGDLYCARGQGKRILVDGKQAWGPKLSKTAKVWCGAGPFKNYLRSVCLPQNAEVLELEIGAEVAVDPEEFADYL